MDDSAQSPTNDPTTEDVDGRTTSGPKHPHDAHGHFVHVDHTSHEAASQHVNPITQFLHDETSVHKGNDDELLDVHIGNPLKKITELLEQIKKQKAFSFTLKGSLGIMGVVLVAGTFGILGGTKALCDKGVQTKMGQIKILQYQDPAGETWIDYIPFVSNFLPHSKISRTVLITPDNRILRLILKDNFTFPTNPYTPNAIPSYLATGQYDSCSETLTVTDPSALQPSQ